MSTAGNIAIGGAVLGGLAIVYLIVKKFSDIDLTPDLSGLNPFKTSNEAIKAKKKYLSELKFIEDGKWSIGDTTKDRISSATKLSIFLFNTMRGASDYKDYAKVRAAFERLKYKNDVRAVVKRFGVPYGQTLLEWVLNEKMEDKDKNYIETKIIQALN